MAYLIVRKRDDFEIGVVVWCILLFSMACLWSRAIVRRRTATIYVLSSSYGLQQASKKIERSVAQRKKCQCRRYWTIFSPWYNNINRLLTTIIEKERGRERDTETERERRGMTLKSTNQKSAVFCSIFLSVIDEYRLCLAALAVSLY